ncbi:MAG: SCO family protein [Ehrlichia sp.]
MKTTKSILNIFLLLFAIFIGYSYITKKNIFQKQHHGTTEINTSNRSDINSSFSLINQDGVTLNSKDFLGKHMLVLFGFSSCQSICPTELGLASELLSQLADESDKLQVIFITIDPQNDTVDKLKEFHEKFDSRIQMLTGSPEDINQIIKNYKIYVGQADESGQINHSAIMYIIDKEGNYLTHFVPDLESKENQIDKLLSLIKQHL